MKNTTISCGRTDETISLRDFYTKPTDNEKQLVSSHRRNESSFPDYLLQ